MLCWGKGKELFVLTLAYSLLVGFAGITSEAIATPLEATGKATDYIVFFYVLNLSGKDIEVKALANQKELLHEKIESKVGAPAGGEEHPPPGIHPARELKVKIDRETSSLEVQEINSGLKATFDITNFSTKGLGFRITIEEKGISLNQDYLPVR